MRIHISDDLSPEAKTVLGRIPGAQVDFKPGMKPEELREVIAMYDALAVRSATKVTADLLAAAPRLRVIGRAGTGVDNIDLQAATRRGVVVMNAPGGNSVSVAEHTLALLLALARSIADASQSTRGGRWEKKKFSSGRELFGKTLGVIGTGNIGALVVQRAKAFGMGVVGYDPFLSAEAASKLGLEQVDLTELYRRSDAITLHVPLTEQTTNRIGAPQLALMKEGALLVNCARGGLVDEKALADALRSKHLGGAAVDVFETEPPRASRSRRPSRVAPITRSSLARTSSPRPTWAARPRTPSRTSPSSSARRWSSSSPPARCATPSTCPASRAKCSSGWGPSSSCAGGWGRSPVRSRCRASAARPRASRSPTRGRSRANPPRRSARRCSRACWAPSSPSRSTRCPRRRWPRSAASPSPR